MTQQSLLRSIESSIKANKSLWNRLQLPARSFGFQIRERVRLVKFESLVYGGSLD